jgi:hypothetical protein
MTSLTRLCRIRLFSVYCKAKITHLIPLLTFGPTKQIQESWKTIRRVIFRSVLRCDTTPKEVMGMYKMGFYELMVRPLIKILDSQKYQQGSPEKNHLRWSLNNCLLVWQNQEENLSNRMITEIANLTTDQNIEPNLKQLDEIRRNDNWTRLSRGELNSDFKRSYILPTVLLYASNAKVHEIEERLKKVRQTQDELVRKGETVKITDLLSNYMGCMEYLRIYANESERPLSTDWDTAVESLTLDENIIRERVTKLSHYPKIAHEILLEARNQIISKEHSVNQRIKCEAMRQTVNNFRQAIKSVSYQAIWDSERILSEGLMINKFPDDIELTKEKRKPGRPTKEKNKKNDANSIKIDEVFKKTSLNTTNNI